MRHPPCHFLPGRHFLRLDELRQIFKDQARIPRSLFASSFIREPCKSDGDESALYIQLPFQRRVVALVGQHPIVHGLEQVEPEFLERFIGRTALETGPPISPRIRSPDGLKVVISPLRSMESKTGRDRLDHGFDIGAASIEFQIRAAASEMLASSSFDLLPCRSCRHTIERIDRVCRFHRSPLHQSGRTNRPVRSLPSLPLAVGSGTVMLRAT